MATTRDILDALSHCMDVRGDTGIAYGACHANEAEGELKCVLEADAFVVSADLCDDLVNHQVRDKLERLDELEQEIAEKNSVNASTNDKQEEIKEVNNDKVDVYRQESPIFIAKC